MKGPVLKLAVLSLLGLAVAGAPVLARAQTTNDAKPAAEKMGTSKAEKKTGAIPFNGKVAVIDKKARTFKVGERTFIVTPETRMTRNGQPAQFDDAAVGDEVGGNYKVGEGGKLEIQTVRFGPRPEAEGKGQPKKGKKSME